MKRLLAALVACCLLSISYKLQADNEDEYLQSAVRSITHTTADSTVVLHVKVSSKSTDKLNDKLFYYWEKNGVIHKNQGSFSENILHGKYTTKNAKGMMVTEGYFYNGTKDSYWKKWNDNGMLIHVDLWEKGCQKRAERYDNNTLSEEIIYGRGGEPKKKLNYTSTKKKIYIYKDGAWVEKRKLLSLFKRKKNLVNADISVVNEAQ